MEGALSHNRSPQPVKQEAVREDSDWRKTDPFSGDWNSFYPILIPGAKDYRGRGGPQLEAQLEAGVGCGNGTLGVSSAHTDRGRASHIHISIFIY